MKNIFKKITLLILISLFLFSQSAFAAESITNSSSKNNVDYLKSVIDMIKEKYRGQISEDQLIEAALKGMFGTMDKYTTFFNKQESNDFFSNINGSYEGIGVGMNPIGKYMSITKVFSASPAERAGILIGDMIAEVDGKNMANEPIEKLQSLIKGPSGTKVKIGVIRAGSTDIITIEVTRGQITLNPVTYEITDDIGYIKLDSFSSNSAENISKTLSVLDSKGISKIILDLRNNPGGEVNQCVAIAKNFVPKGIITKLDFKSEAIPDETYYSDLLSSKYKLVVLVNGMSASASELLSGAIQDTKVGTLVGVKTFGKAKVQSLYPILTPEAFAKYEAQLGVKIVDGNELITKYGISLKENEISGFTKITIGEYTTPLGRMIDLIGLTPDVVVEDYKLVNNIDINSITPLSSTWKPTLNNEGIDVYNAEKILSLLGYKIDAPDINLDLKTFYAISEFKKSQGEYPDGALDFTAQRLLNQKLAELRISIDLQYKKAIELLK